MNDTYCSLNLSISIEIVLEDISNVCCCQSVSRSAKETRDPVHEDSSPWGLSRHWGLGLRLTEFKLPEIFNPNKADDNLIETLCSYLLGKVCASHRILVQDLLATQSISHDIDMRFF